MQSDFTFQFLGGAVTVSSETLLVLAVVLLVIAGAMLVLRRKNKVALEPCLVTDELMVHLSRIADALERQAARPIDKIIVEALKQAERPAPAQPQEVSTEPRSIPYSMFGREVQPSR